GPILQPMRSAWLALTTAIMVLIQKLRYLSYPVSYFLKRSTQKVQERSTSMTIKPEHTYFVCCARTELCTPKNLLSNNNNPFTSLHYTKRQKLCLFRRGFIFDTFTTCR